MILAIDQGTTGTTCLVFDHDGRIRGRAYSEFAPALPAPGLGRARRERDLGGDEPRRLARPRRREGGRGQPLRRRDHEPARDGRRLGSEDRRAGPQRARLAGPADGGALPRAPGRGSRGARPRAHRPRPRPVLLGDEDRVAAAKRPRGERRGLRDDRLLARPQAHRPPRDRPHERVADDALRHRRASLGPRALRAVRRRPGAARRAVAVRPRLRDDERVRLRGAGRRDRRRPAGGAVRPGLPRSRGRRRTRTAPGASCSSTPARSRRRRPRAC